MRISREIGIDMGHRVPDHRSKCKNLHGHRYRVIATVQGSLHEEGEQTGMVVDYGFLKQIMMETVDAWFDHGMALWVQDPLLLHELGSPVGYVREKTAKFGWCIIPADAGWRWGKLVVMHDVPTAENLAKLWYKMMAPGVNQMLHDSDDRLYSVTVWETPNCSATYRPNVTGPAINAHEVEQDTEEWGKDTASRV
jgi:6-pyruvoyltetrahydropterin/6-carboxytetrahydropterin synthase